MMSTMQFCSAYSLHRMSANVKSSKKSGSNDQPQRKPSSDKPKPQDSPAEELKVVEQYKFKGHEIIADATRAIQLGATGLEAPKTHTCWSIFSTYFMGLFFPRRTNSQSWNWLFWPKHCVTFSIWGWCLKPAICFTQPFSRSLHRFIGHMYHI